MYGDQKRFDKNGDGRLSGNEWLNWYTGKYGVNIENQERRAVGSEVGYSAHSSQRSGHCVYLKNGTPFLAKKKKMCYSLRKR